MAQRLHMEERAERYPRRCWQTASLRPPPAVFSSASPSYIPREQKSTPVSRTVPYIYTHIYICISIDAHIHIDIYEESEEAAAAAAERRALAPEDAKRRREVETESREEIKKEIVSSRCFKLPFITTHKAERAGKSYQRPSCPSTRIHKSPTTQYHRPL